MTILRNEGGPTRSLMECPHCEVYGLHELADLGDGNVFQCALCFAMFTDADAAS